MQTDQLQSLEVVYRPGSEVFTGSPAGQFAARYGIANPADLLARSIADPSWFWAASAEDVGLEWMRPYDEVLDLSDGAPFPHFFRGGRLNWADYAVDKWVRRGRGDARAIWWEGDDGD